ncbi:MAG: helix-turn-helix domain-containing protein, partial [Anaerolineaceae bacterium]|nr:helix-turn-helix domain-containing protein [Anaerolineaceae bacterium]
MPPSAQNPTVERTLYLVEMLLANPKGITPQEMLLHLDISRSTLFLMLRTLKSLGYIEQSEKRGRYRLGPRLEAWRTSPSLTSQDLLTAFYMETSKKEWPETLVLALPSMQGPIVLAQAEGNRQVRSIFTPGQVQPELQAAIEALNPEPSTQVRTNGYCL